ncbi:MAG: triose-phosphate isomerase [Deltaproteobacteria bacterium]|nr:triose-phosphate isomerase [Deltaproteobacteria bacterium]
MRVPFVAGNWKMHKTVGESLELVDQLTAGTENIGAVEIGIAPPFTALHAVSKRITGTKLRLCAQNVHFETQGAFTGEISVAMLKDVGCHYGIVGHSERRSLFGETDEGCGRKVGALLRGGLRAILCVGETLAERDGGRTLDVVTRQLEAGLAEVTADHATDVVIAYEPVWAIGTGRNATPAQAEEVHAHLRRVLEKKLGAGAAEAMRIQYGGSVKADNARDLFTQANVDGGLIGGASLKADSFLAIANAAAR